MIDAFRIVRRLRDTDAFPFADVDADFALEPDGTVAIDEFLDRPGVSLFALDHDHGGVAFVETPPEHDLVSEPFLHQAQRKHATRVFRVPHAQFHALAEAAPEPTGPPLLLQSVGRCGSTLVSRILRKAPGIVSLSEPDVFTGIGSAHAAGSMTSEDAVAILRSALRLAGHGLAPPGTRTAIKFRSELAWISLLIDEAAPDARTLFMYRDARRVIESYKRVFGRTGGWKDHLVRVPGLDVAVVRRHRRRIERRGPQLERFAFAIENATPHEIEKRGRWGRHLVLWLAKVHGYLRLREVRPDVAAFRYEDLVASPASVVRQIFERWDLPQESLAAAVDTMDRDSQRGTALERGSREAWRLTPREEREIARTIRECTPLSGPDAILPGTLSPER